LEYQQISAKSKVVRFTFYIFWGDLTRNDPITCWAKKPTTSAAVLIRNETIEPIIPGKAAADFLAISFNHSANFFKF
jgi:hypothetical protein